MKKKKLEEKTIKFMRKKLEEEARGRIQMKEKIKEKI